jgi:hypothetical protein
MKKGRRSALESARALHAAGQAATVRGRRCTRKGRGGRGGGGQEHRPRKKRKCRAEGHKKQNALCMRASA